MKALQCSFELTQQRRGSRERDLVRAAPLAKVEIASVQSSRWSDRGKVVPLMVG